MPAPLTTQPTTPKDSSEEFYSRRCAEDTDFLCSPQAKVVQARRSGWKCAGTGKSWLCQDRFCQHCAYTEKALAKLPQKTFWNAHGHSSRRTTHLPFVSRCYDVGIAHPRSPFIPYPRFGEHLKSNPRLHRFIGRIQPLKGYDYAERITSASRQNDRQKRINAPSRYEKRKGIRRTRKRELLRDFQFNLPLAKPLIKSFIGNLFKRFEKLLAFFGYIHIHRHKKDKEKPPCLRVFGTFLCF